MSLSLSLSLLTTLCALVALLAPTPPGPSQSRRPTAPLTMAGQTFDIRWAREQPVTNGRTIVLITDKPVYFVGGGNVNAKPREGYDVALLQFSMDDAGLGFKGTMAAAARVKPGGDAGVQIDDYAEKPIELRTINRTIK